MASSIPPTVRHLQIKEFSPDFRKATAVVDIPSSLLLSALADSPDSVLVKISYTTVRASDRNDSNGRYGALNGFPFTAGYEAVGRVVKAGKDVTRFKAGDAVGMLLFKRGGASEYNVVPSSECFPLPTVHPDFLTFFNAGLTALCGLVLPNAGHIRIKPGSPMSKYFPENVDTVEPYRPEICVITAAAGGVGLQACQFALAAGNIVVGLAGNEEKLAALAKLGVQHAVNYKAHGSPRELAAHIGKLAGRDVDLVWETVGGEMLVALSEIIGENGRLVIIGQISGGYGDEASAKQRQADLDKPSELRGAGVLLAAPNPARDKALENLQQKNAKLTGYFMSITGTDCFDTFARFVAAQVGLWESKDLRPVTDDSQKFRGIDAYVDGVEYLHRGQNIGKIVVTVAED